MSIGRVPGATGIQPSIVDAKGDLIVATAADSVDRLAVGSANQVLTVDSTTATGLKWATPGGSTLNTSLIASGSITSGTSLTFSSLTSYDQLFLQMTNLTTGTAGSQLSVRINSSSSAVYVTGAIENRIGGTLAGTGSSSGGGTEFQYGFNYGWKNTNQNGILFSFTNCKSSSGFTNVEAMGTWEHFNTTDRIIHSSTNTFASNATVSSISIYWNDGYSFTGGTYRLYGAA